jgi:hypothetical protein
VIDQMPDLRPLASQGIRSDGEARICDLFAGNTLDVHGAEPHMPEASDGGRGFDCQAAAVAGEGVAR